MYKITVTKRGYTPEQVKEFPGLIRSGLVTVARQWRRDTLPQHFNSGAAAKYGYVKRTEKYQRYKNRRGRGPLQWSGKAMKKILMDRREPVLRGNTKIILKLKCPGFFNWRYRRRQGDWPKTMADEVRTILPRERQAIADAVQQEVVDRLKGKKDAAMYKNARGWELR